MSNATTGSRKIFSLPAVTPSTSVNSVSLIHVLSLLADDVLALRGAAFPVHRKYAREALRQVVVIREFLADVVAEALPASAFVGLAELHVALQKLGHLLRDLARPGARLWVLVNSDRVSNNFRALFRSVATALEVLPLGAASPEVMELVQLVAEQAWKAEGGTLPSDALAARIVWSALALFENGIEPDLIDLNDLMEHLQIRSWSDCSEEIAFLEDLFFDCEENEAASIGSLEALMAYCRATLFDADDHNKRTGGNQFKALHRPVNHVNLDDLRCPISLELMLDPVTIATGQTYDRASISKWLKSGCLTCPVTGKKLTDTAFVSNYAVQHLVEQLCASKNLSFPEPNSKQKRDGSKTATPPSSAAAGAMKMAAAFLVRKLAFPTSLEQSRAAFEVRRLSKSNVFNRTCLVEAGAVPWLLHLSSSMDSSTQDNAMAALLNLSKHPSGARAIVEVGGLGLVVDVIRLTFKVEAQQNAVAILFYLSLVEEYRAAIGDLPEAIPLLVELMREGSYRGKKNAIVTIFGLSLCSSNRVKILESGAVPALMALLSGQEKGNLANDSMAVLAKIAEHPDGTAKILCYDGAISRLVEFFRSTGTSRSGRESCVSALLSLCVNGGAEVVELLRSMPVVMPPLYSLVTEGSPQAGKKARSLLNRIHEV
ncbi:U-box domain-containing protein 18-like [Zingiber officinale]|uniref:RING-type E3 ubiquitin transferase n=1 Tax=Zingiber officinale TaxID=94328 RepID=A0A8J5GD21_ZINOF|nr:U-box domain-containing protein 18-like [Zingiber officinale]KAG6501007.1 hypothetical protein ZIOFF_040872 [Zingiber officinale]